MAVIRHHHKTPSVAGSHTVKTLDCPASLSGREMIGKVGISMAGRTCHQIDLAGNRYAPSSQALCLISICHTEIIAVDESVNDSRMDQTL